MRKMPRPYTRHALRIVALTCLVLLAACSRIEDAALKAGVEADRSRSGAEVRSVPVDGSDIYYLERAGDGPAVVLVHGFGAEKDIWLAMLRELPESWHVFIPDMPGHGDTADPDDSQPLSAAWYAQQLHAFIDAAGIERPGLVGSSMGGLIAIRHALDHPGTVSWLALLAPAGVQAPERSELEQMLAAGDNPLLVQDRADLERLLALVYFDPPVLPWPVRPAVVRRMAERGPFLSRLSDELFERAEFVDDELEELQVPTLVVWGEHDRLIDPSAADVYARQVPVVEVQQLPGIGHSPMTEAPARTAQLIAAFMSGLDRAADARGE